MQYVVTILTILEVLTALLLIGIVLIQQSKTGGGFGGLAGGMTESVFGASAGNVLTKTTVILASVFLGLALIVGAITGRLELGTSVADSIESEPAPTSSMSPGETQSETKNGQEATSEDESATGTDSETPDEPAE